MPLFKFLFIFKIILKKIMPKFSVQKPWDSLLRCSRLVKVISHFLCAPSKLTLLPHSVICKVSFHTLSSSFTPKFLSAGRIVISAQAGVRIGIPAQFYAVVPNGCLYRCTRYIKFNQFHDEIYFKPLTTLIVLLNTDSQKLLKYITGIVLQ